jgi:hypothetical protein
MNTVLLKNIPCKIHYDIPHSIFTQGEIEICCKRQFIDKSVYFKKRTDGVDNVTLPSFMDMLMYTTNDFMFSKEEYKRSFEQHLVLCEHVLKEITTKHRKLKTQIMEVLEDKSYLCDYPDCMVFFADLLKVNLIVVVDNKYMAKHLNEKKYTKTLIIQVQGSSYDFHYDKYAIDSSQYSPYVSEKLMQNIKLSDLQEVYSKMYKTSAKNRKKADMTAEILNELMI